jgi:hypothetical protein
LAVARWVFSPIKFKADMGVCLAFMFVWNMVGALILAPALGVLLLGPKEVATPLLAVRLRDNPAAMGLTVDGDAVPAGQVQRAETGLTVRQAATMGQFWPLMAVALLIGIGVYGIMINLVRS